MASNSKNVYRQLPVKSARSLGAFKYCVGDYSPSGYSDVRDRAVESFESESARVFSLELDPEEKRIELIRPLVIKVLLYVGFLPTRQSRSVVAKVIELLAKDPETDVDKFLADTAKRTDTDFGTLKKMLERAFDPFDAELVGRVKKLTGTSPFTSRDMIYDLALYVRKKYIGRCVHA